MDDPLPADRRLLRGRGRWRLFAGFWLVYLAPAFGTAWTEHTGVDRWARLLLLAAFCYVYADLVARALTGGRRELRWAAPALLFVLGAALAILTGPDALGSAVYLVVAGAVLLPPRAAAVIAVGSTLVVGALPGLVPGWEDHDGWTTAGSVALGALAAFGFTALLRRTQQLRDAQAEVSRLAAERERLRIARDLHDLLGHSLTTVAVKAALAQRLVSREPSRATAEMADVEALARQGLVDVRAAVAGYREVSLGVEIATAREVLAAAGIRVTLSGPVDEVPAELRGLFGWAVREGVTNAVRHSRAGHVRIAVTPGSVEIADDGVGSATGAPGSGLAGLAERAARSGAVLSAGPLPGGGYRLAVTLSEPGTSDPPVGPTADPPVGPAAAVQRSPGPSAGPSPEPVAAVPRAGGPAPGPAGAEGAGVPAEGSAPAPARGRRR